MSTTDVVEFWNGVHASRPAADPRPNVCLTERVIGLPPGDVLDLGCGGGGDALWLARLGWHVTAVDVSSVAVERLRGVALAHGLSDRISAQQHDLRRSFPDGTFDLVCAHYLHTPSTWTGRSYCARQRTRCARAAGCWSWTMDRQPRGRGPRTRMSGARPRRRSLRTWPWTRRPGRSRRPTRRHGPRPVRTAAVPSGTNLLGLLNHLTHVERATFLGARITDWPATFHASPSDTAADVVTRYRESVTAANAVLERCVDPAAPLPAPGRASPHPLSAGHSPT